MKSILLRAAIALPLCCSVPALAAEPAVLTLEEAIGRALDTSPRLGAAEAAIRASRGGERQAAVRPNPEIAVDVENFAGRGAYGGLRSAETTAGLTQTIELGGKRSARRAVAAGDRRLAEIELERETLDLRRDVTLAYGEALAAEERLTLARGQLALADDVAATVRRYVRAARDPLLEESKAELARTTAALALAQAEREARTARRQLSLLVGLDQADVTLDRRVLVDGSPPPGVQDLRAGLRGLPDLRLHEAGIARGRSAMALEQAQAVPDPRLNFGLRDFADTGSTAFVMGLSVPLPVFDRNQGGIERARQEIVRAEQSRLQAERDLERLAFEARAAWETAAADRATLERTALPQASRALALARDGYDRGLFNYLQVLDAQRALQDVRVQIIDSMKRAFLARATLARLTARDSTE